jgi:hypothetical protein
VIFTFYWPDTQKWEGGDFVVTIDGAPGIATALTASEVATNAAAADQLPSESARA